MTPEDAVMKLLQDWSPDVTTLLKLAGYFSPSMSEVAKEEIAQKIGFGKGGRLYNKIKAASAEKNWEIAKIVINEESLIELKQGARQVAKELGIPFSEFDWNPVAQKYFKEEGLKLVKGLTATDLKRLKQEIQTHFGLNEKTFARKYGASYSCSPYRMKTIFRTEKFRAINAGEYLEAKEVGAVTKTWQHSTGPNPRKDHLAMTGETVGIDELFSDGEQYPQMVNCRCRVDYSFTGKGRNWAGANPRKSDSQPKKETPVEIQKASPKAKGEKLH